MFDCILFISHKMKMLLVRKLSLSFVSCRLQNQTRSLRLESRSLRVEAELNSKSAHFKLTSSQKRQVRKIKIILELDSEIGQVITIGLPVAKKSVLLSVHCCCCCA